MLTFLLSSVHKDLTKQLSTGVLLIVPETGEEERGGEGREGHWAHVVCLFLFAPHPVVAVVTGDNRE